MNEYITFFTLIATHLIIGLLGLVIGYVVGYVKRGIEKSKRHGTS